MNLPAVLAFLWLWGVGEHAFLQRTSARESGLSQGLRGLPAGQGYGDSSPKWTEGLGPLKTRQTLTAWLRYITAASEMEGFTEVQNQKVS